MFYYDEMCLKCVNSIYKTTYPETKPIDNKNNQTIIHPP